MKRLDYIDALRGWAIVGVLTSHVSQHADSLSGKISYFTQYGPMGVRLFFIISALTIFITLDKKKQDKKERINYFFIKRVLRIAPMYYLAIIYYIIFGVFFFSQIDYVNVISNMFFVHGLSPQTINSFVPGGWSITVEMFFYCLIPVIIKQINNLNNAITFLVVSYLFRFIAIYLTRRLIGNEGINGEFLFLFFPSQLPVFALGIILYFIIIKQEKIRISIYNAVALLILAAISLVFKYYNIIFVDYLLFSYAFSVLIIIMSKKKIFLLDNFIIRFIGNISYSLYIIHFIVIFWLVKYQLNLLYQSSSTINFCLFFTITLLLSCFVSYITYQLIEKPFQNLGKKLISKKQKPIFNK